MSSSVSDPLIQVNNRQEGGCFEWLVRQMASQVKCFGISTFVLLVTIGIAIGLLFTFAKETQTASSPNPGFQNEGF